MAFTTTTGENGTDYIGSEGVDALFVLNDNSGKIMVDALGGGDNVDLTNETGVIGDAEVKLGEGNDIFTTGANDTNNNRLKDSTVNGGPGNDDITTEGTINTKLRGNEGDDDFFLLSNYTNTTINGNAGQDSFTLANGAGGVNNITLSDSKILGGSGNDGQMDFTNGSILAVDSVIQGGKGLDTITIGDLTAGLSNFRVSGGADNDTINVNNTTGGADGAAYNGAAGDDSFNFGQGTGGNAADAVSKGGDGSDRYVIDGSGAINASGEAGNDFFTIDGTAGARNTINGGAGADTYTLTTAAQRGQTIVISSVSDSPATTTGSTFTGDTFTNDVLTATKTSGGDIIDMTGGSGEELVGNRLNSASTGVFLPGTATAVNGEVLIGAALASTAGTFAALKTALDTTLVASVSNLANTSGGAANTNTGVISLQLIAVDNGANGTVEGIDGFYAILNNTNQIVDSGDMMLKLSTTLAEEAAAAGTAAAELLQIEAAIEAGF